MTRDEARTCVGRYGWVWQKGRFRKWYGEFIEVAGDGQYVRFRRYSGRIEGDWFPAEECNLHPDRERLDAGWVDCGECPHISTGCSAATGCQKGRN